MYLSLQNGSDVRGVALDGVPGEAVNLTPAIARTIAYGFATWLADQCDSTPLRVAVGHDSRLSAAAIKHAVFQGLEQAGCEVFDCNLASTPAMFMGTVFPEHGYHGSIMLTASHLPFNRNGLKFFTRQGGLGKPDIRAILEIAEATGELPERELERTSQAALMNDYAAHLVQLIRQGAGCEQPLSGLKIVVDAGNGAGGFFVDQVLIPLGADTTGSQFLEPDGSFPNHIPNPEDKDAMDAIIQAVTGNQADFGIIFDTDVDRAGAVDKNGKPINRNRFIALMAAIVLDEHPGSTIVTDSVTSTGLKWWIEDKLGGIHLRFKRGYKNVINEAIRLNDAGTPSFLALETSG
ncbi:MAG: phosphohexomutase domain-containing protein, partial [Planctomycetota bacterium]